MKPLYTQEEFDKAKGKDLLPLECYECRKTFYKRKKDVKDYIRGHGTGQYCSKTCYGKSIFTSIETKCSQCGKLVVREEFKIKKSKLGFSFCSHSCSASYSNKRRKRFKKIKFKKQYKKNVPLIETMCLYCQKAIIHKENNPKKYHKDCWLKASGGVRKGSSRSKHGWYKDYWCDSSYELAFVIYCLEHNINIKRNTEGFEYEFKGKKSKYYPDFLVNNEYVEIKNYKSELTDAKISQFPHEIQVLYKNLMKISVLPYTISKYGKNFVSLYEKYTASAQRESNPYSQPIT